MAYLTIDPAESEKRLMKISIAPEVFEKCAGYTAGTVVVGKRP
jgi:hypothetical protein